MRIDRRFCCWAPLLVLLLIPAACGSGSSPRVQVLGSPVDYGKVPVGKIVAHRFLLRNAGDAPLKITNQLLPGNTLQTKALEGC